MPTKSEAQMLEYEGTKEIKRGGARWQEERVVVVQN
jgi:hypothetical protein